MQEDSKPDKPQPRILPPLHLKTLAALLSVLSSLLLFHALQHAFYTGPDYSAEQVANQDARTIPAEPEPVAPANTLIEVTVKNGDTLSSLFKDAGFGAQLVDEILLSNKEARILKNLFPGNRLTFEIDAEHTLVSLDVSKSPLENYRFTKKPTGGFEYRHSMREPEIKLVAHEAVIEDSLFAAAQKSGIPATMTMELIGIFDSAIDFILDTREGDRFKVLFEEQYLDGNRIGFGKILAAEFVNQGKSITAIRYEDSTGNTGFYSPKGETMRKAFLLNPVDFTRVSSGFSLSRKHPILNTIRAHKGTDYAAPQGTPVKATSDGRITFAGMNGSFGKLIVIQHNSRFMTKYAHLSNFSKVSKQGAHVRQGEIIGYVGATGAATGPHLHYEFLMDGVHRDSRKIYDKLPQAESLSPREMAGFRQISGQYLALLQTTRDGSKLASSSQAKKNGTLQ
jgi:murein DD-endopeptidase MepM/ murein hydrolase activator NlpD